MFGGSRRHRQANQPLTAATANPNAATAAASAFARRASSSSSLSSAAAAAALRARPTTPINVAEVQTKRTQKRSASVSSLGSQDTRRSLQRSPSQSSMTERTFRSPSPHRTPAGPEDAPPVPTIPDDMRSNGGGGGGGPAHARATSLQMQPFRVASQKTRDGAGSWFGAATEGDMANVRTSDAPLRVASPESRSGAVSPTSSINFSYPRGLHGISPPATPTIESMKMTSSQRLASPRRAESVTSRSAASDQTLVYDPNSRRMVPKVDLLAREQIIRDASEKPVKKKRQQHQQGLPIARSGSHLAKGTMGRTQTTAVEVEAKRQEQPRAQKVHDTSAGAAQQRTMQGQSPIRKTPQPATMPTQVEKAPPRNDSPSRPSTAEKPISPPSTMSSPESNRQSSVSSPEPEQPLTQDVRKTDGATVLPHSEPRKGAPVLARKPSTVQEESEDDLESSEDEAVREPAAQHDVADVLDAVPVRSSAVPKQPSLSSESTVVEPPVVATSERQPSPPEHRQNGSVRASRTHSSSPGRSARFVLGADQLVVRHEPPPRSVSPRKSAMKHSTSPSRGASPTDESSEASGPSRYGNEVAAGETSMARKKSVRVSFDDENTKVVGQAVAKPELDSPVPPSPQQAKRHWYNHLGRNRKKDIVELDDDEIMKPRPALPSFGSVREKKNREVEEERPLVRPIEPPSPSSPATSAKPTSPMQDEAQSAPVGQSSDDNIGAILSQEQTARNAANISRFREPLPPVVTSMEGSGYYSPSSTSSDDEYEDHEIVQEPDATLPPEQVREEILANHRELDGAATESAAHIVPGHQKETKATQSREDVPAISVIQPTPTPKETMTATQSGPSDPGYFDVPGQFPEDDSDDASSSPTAPLNSSPPNEVQSQGPRNSERTVAFAPSAQKTTYEPLAEETESEGDSIYSDAYEDLSEADGGGFMSLDAIITTPIPEKVSQKLFEKVLAAPSPHTADSSREGPAQAGPGSAAAQPEDEWERAKVYWRGLTSDKRKQLEKEAMEEAGAEGDLEEVVQPKKTKRKKSVRRNDPTEQPKVVSDTDRVYQIQPGTRVVDEEEAPPRTLRCSQLPHDSGNRKLQKSLRGTQAQGPAVAGMGMRKTLRNDPSTAPAQTTEQAQVGNSGGRMRKSMRQNGSSGMSPSSRPLSLQGPPPARDVDQEKRSKHTSLDASMTSTEMAKAMQATLRRRASDSSESSFKRARPRKEGLGFRRSMRSNAATPDPSTAGRNSRFSLRSASPPGSPPSPPVSMGTRMTMRTLRSDSSDGSTRRMRLPSFGKSSTKKSTGRSGNKSRFGDSSDEEDAGPSTFRSRFAESSDEDEPTPLPVSHVTPKNVRSSSSAAAAEMKTPPPLRHDEKGDESPDLPDSSDEEEMPVESQKHMSPRQVSGASGRLVKSQSDNRGLQRAGSGRGALAESATAPAMGTQVMSRPSHQRRGSFLSVLRRKKDNDMGKISRPTPGESAARTDTKLERSPEDISALRNNITSPKSKLQKSPTDNWPLVEKTIDDEKRPMSADNDTAMDASRPVFAQRRSTNQVLTRGPGELDTQLDSTKKKKKFGALRRMFKLDD
ncbi:hypothetical protein CMUS01_09727 [Colletotrichum musicola]|uniref:Uncharacterized protein n=1 Tax=Colletotrichum musicola TaxID=2175873 RepID=A0A8H6K693_9PEZI|nr:hypothetical protein CMUS01_09727 [Colletotrichum musicola]